MGTTERHDWHTKERPIMLDCMILGDSIAVGTHMFYRGCELYAKGGINTWQWNRMYPTIRGDVKTVIISLGTNDHAGVNTRQELEATRTKIKAEKVFWILPHGNNPASGISISTIQEIVREIAKKNGDTVIAIEGIQSDNIHPSWPGYKKIVEKVKNGLDI
jgi:lysophospholipase L1-like esterase